MKVVFLETVEGSASMGEVKTVAPGYARNYLLPRGLAAPATPDVLARAERLREIERLASAELPTGFLRDTLGQIVALARGERGEK